MCLLGGIVAFLAIGVGSVEVRRPPKNVLLAKNKETVSISSQFPARAKSLTLILLVP